jgi:hypothetical protein
MGASETIPRNESGSKIEAGEGMTNRSLNGHFDGLAEGNCSAEIPEVGSNSMYDADCI